MIHKIPNVQCLFLFLALFVAGALQAQTDSTINKNTYRAWARTLNNDRPKNGVLFSVKDSSIVLSKYEKRYDRYGKSDVTEIKISAIDHILVRKKGNILKGTAIGAMAGICSGLLIQIFLLPVDKNKSEIRPFPLIVTGIGAGVGAALGSMKIKIPIGGRQDQFEWRRKDLNKYAKKIK
jgi:hypothetical protein